MRLENAGLEDNRAAPCGDRFVQLSHIPQDNGQIVVSFGAVGIKRNSFADQLRGRLRAARLAGDRAQHVQRIRVQRRKGDDLHINLLRVAKSPRPMVRKGQLERLLNR